MAAATIWRCTGWSTIQGVRVGSWEGWGGVHDETDWAGKGCLGASHRDGQR